MHFAQSVPFFRCDRVITVSSEYGAEAVRTHSVYPWLKLKKKIQTRRIRETGRVSSHIACDWTTTFHDKKTDTKTYAKNESENLPRSKTCYTLSVKVEKKLIGGEEWLEFKWCYTTRRGRPFKSPNFRDRGTTLFFTFFPLFRLSLSLLPPPSPSSSRQHGTYGKRTRSKGRQLVKYCCRSVFDLVHSLVK